MFVQILRHSFILVQTWLLLIAIDPVQPNAEVPFN